MLKFLAKIPRAVSALGILDTFFEEFWQKIQNSVRFRPKFQKSTTIFDEIPPKIPKSRQLHRVGCKCTID